MTPTPTARPNILFMIADDHRFDALAAVGNTEIKTPNFDRLIARGACFTKSYIMGSTSGAVCMPSRGMLLSGRNLFDINAPDLEGRALWPERLRASGYTTFGVGKWHNEPASYARCFSGGDAIFFGGMSEHARVPLWDFAPGGDYPNEPDRVGDGFSSTLFADAAIDFLETYEAPDPYCLYVAFTAPHDPRTPPEDYTYDPETVSLPRSYLPEHPFDNGDLEVRDEHLAPIPREPEVVKQHTADYYGMISHLDAEIGRILHALEARGDLDNTLVVYTADHGIAIGRHGLMGKQSLYDHSVRVPLILSGPTIPAGNRRNELCYMPDLYPTLCRLTGEPTPTEVVYRDLHPEATHVEGRDHIFSAYLGVQRMVRDERYKLIVYRVGEEAREQLFDLQEDPYELEDLSQREAYADISSALRRNLEEWQNTVQDPYRSAYST